MQNRTFLVVLRSIFSKKLKIAAPIEKQPPLKRLDFRVGPKNQSQNRWRPFFFFFWRPPDFRRKKPLNLRFRPKIQSQNRWRPFFLETTSFWAEKTFEFEISAENWRTPFFFGEHLGLGGKNLWICEKVRLNFPANRVKLIQEQWKFGSRSFAHFSLFQNSFPFSKSWLRAWLLLQKSV